MRSLANIVRRKKPWITAEILNMCDKRRDLRKKRFEPEGSEKYKEVNTNTQRYTKKAKENWKGEQCREIEDNPKKNSRKRAYHLMKDLTAVKQRKKLLLSKIVQKKNNASQKNESY